MEDNELIDSIISGRHEDYSHLVRKYHVRIIGLCSSLLADPVSAQDAAQEIFLKAFLALRDFRKDSSFSTWLYRISANHCKDLLRKHSREKTESLDALIEEKGELIQQLLAHFDDPRPSMADAELVERVLSSIAPDYRLILTLREAQGLSYQELARALGCSIDAVKARLRRARRMMQDKLRHFFSAGDV